MMQISGCQIRSPVRTPETEAFWDAANERRLLFASCRSCGKPHGYPRRVCPFCLSTEIDWKDASGRGKIHAFSVFRRANPPYVSSWVMLAEGVAILTNIVDCETSGLAIDAPVQVVFRPADAGQLVPVFTLA